MISEDVGPTFSTMHPVLEQLGEAHVVVLLLAEAGLDEHSIAARLEVPPPCVAPMLEVARAKLARAVETPASLEP